MSQKRRLIVIFIAVIALCVMAYSMFLLRPTSWWIRGLRHQKQGEYERAIRCFARVIKTRPQYVEAYFYFRREKKGDQLYINSGGIAPCYYALGKYNEAKIYYGKALELYRTLGDRDKVFLIEGMLGQLSALE
ncbi:MAG: tetratricopeptide repeat protein [Candidatus Omnitrophota bacterium]|nr:MAG: tetratricopeptide repeat protein [Candidatus Omnitrophota bacterium]